MLRVWNLASEQTTGTKLQRHLDKSPFAVSPDTNACGLVSAAVSRGLSVGAVDTDYNIKWLHHVQVQHPSRSQS